MIEIIFKMWEIRSRSGIGVNRSRYSDEDMGGRNVGRINEKRVGDLSVCSPWALHQKSQLKLSERRS